MQKLSTTRQLIWSARSPNPLPSMALMAVLCGGWVFGGDLRLTVAAEAGGEPVELHKTALPDRAGRVLHLSRLDWLLSGVALQREDGSWLECRSDWAAYFSLAEGRDSADVEGVAPGQYKAVRFRVGLNPAVDRADPAQWEPGHALHPEVCHLHWGWQGGYVHLALEGRTGAASGEAGRGFSYHLANEPEPMRVELPVRFSGDGPATIMMKFDVGKILGSIAVGDGTESTHSRDGDALALQLKRQVRGAFQISAVHRDLFQPTASVLARNPAPAGTKPHALHVTGRFPKIPLPGDNPLTEEGVKLGERLFHDVRLSGNGTQSCASCHERSQAFSDARRFSIGADGRAGIRQAMPLFNLAWHKELFWDGRAATLREQVLLPIQDPNEMNQPLDRAVAKLQADASYRSQFAGAFGGEGVDASRLARSLEQYLLTLISQDSRFDRAVRRTETLTAEESRGLQLFVTEHDPGRGLRGADCFHCHGGTLFSNHQFANNGLRLDASDLGRMTVTANPADRGKFKVPSLRNIAATAPYMHDGRFATLEDVVAHYNSGVVRSDTLDPNLAKHPATGLGLSPADQRALVAFLRTLTDDAFLNPAANSPPKLAGAKSKSDP